MISPEKRRSGLVRTDHDYGPRSSVFVPLFAVEQVGDHELEPDAGTDVRRMSGALSFHAVSQMAKGIN